MTEAAIGFPWDQLPELARCSVTLTTALARERHQNDVAGVRTGRLADLHWLKLL